MHELEFIAEPDQIRLGIELHLHSQQMIGRYTGRIIAGRIVRSAGILRIYSRNLRSDNLVMRLFNEIPLAINLLVHMPLKLKTSIAGNMLYLRSMIVTVPSFGCMASPQARPAS